MMPLFLNCGRARNIQNHPTWPPAWIIEKEQQVEKPFSPAKPVRGQEYVIDPKIESMHMRLEWNKDVDLDSAVAMFSATGELIDKVCYRHRTSNCGAVTLNADRTRDESASGPEIITVNFENLPMNVHHIIFAAASRNKEISLDDVDGVQVDISLGKEDDDGYCLQTLSKRDLSENLVMVGILARDSVQWKFKPLKSIFKENDFVTVLESQKEQIEKLFNSCPASLPVQRRISVKVLRGRNLAEKHRRWFPFEWTANPYHTIKFKQEERNCCTVSKRTLHPEWDTEPFDTNYITEAETNRLKIFIFSRGWLRGCRFMGKVEVPGYQLFELGSGEHTFWFPLAPSKTEEYSHEDVSGDILVQFTIDEKGK